MSKMIHKISVLEGDWSDEHYFRYLRPTMVSGNKCPIIKHQVIPLTRLHDEEYWKSSSIRFENDIIVLDYQHWMHDDNVFEQYINKICSLKIKYLYLFECPFGYEMPRSNIEQFCKRLFLRTDFAISKIRKEIGQEVKIIAPAIANINPNMMHRLEHYLDFYRNSFDLWSFHCCFDGTSQSFALMSSHLQSLVKNLSKQVWITRWSVPCTFNKNISKMKDGLIWYPFSIEYAKRQLKHFYTCVESICQRNTKWFFTGMCRDIYRDNLFGNDIMWNGIKSNYPYMDYEYTGLSFTGFLGMIDHFGAVKEDLLNEFFYMCKQEN